MKSFLNSLALLSLASVAFLAPRSASCAEPPPAGATYVIPIKGMIERGLLYAVRRGLQEAEAAGAGAVILDMDTPGGKLDAAEQIVLLLLDMKVPTYTFVNPRAISAGAIISFATDHIYMTPTGLIGDAMPILMSPLPMGGPQAVPDDLKEKIMSPTIALMRSAAQAKGHDPSLGEAMIRPEAEYTIGDRVISKAGELLTLTATDAVEPLREGGRPLLAAGTVATLQELLEKIGRAHAPVVTVTVSSTERIARLIEGFPLSGILLALGLLGLYVEFKTPGFGVPGIGGILCLALWFWGHHIAGLAGIWEMVVFAAGIALILVEIFLLPGFGLAGVLGIALVVTGLLFAMIQHIPGKPLSVPYPDQLQSAILNLGITLVCTMLLGMLAARYLPRTSLFSHVALQADVGRDKGYRAPAPKTSVLGMQGIAETALRPAGIGVFGTRRLDVVARGQFIERGRPIVVAEEHGNRIVVDELCHSNSSGSSCSPA